MVKTVLLIWQSIAIIGLVKGHWERVENNPRKTHDKPTSIQHKKDNEVTQNFIPPLYSKLVQKEHFFFEKNVLEYNYLTI